MKKEGYRKTKSICPECLKTIDAEIQLRGDEAYLVKTCETHGVFEAQFWKGEPSLETWSSLSSKGKERNSIKEFETTCPHNCGICSDHLQQTCCVLIEVTQNCNLKCPVCFASAGESKALEPDISQIKDWYQMLQDRGGSYNIQLSGGEPTLRDDLPEIVQMGKSFGFEFIQVNTNGLRLAEKFEYVQGLADAGLDCVFLQFDGLREETYKKIRGKPLLEYKIKAIENCKKANIGIVLVPTLVPEVNVHEIGDILRFAAKHMPSVRGVHFQPISYFGRYPEEETPKRLTLPEVIREIEAQMEGQMPLKAFVPPSSEHPYCSFNSKFMRDEFGKFVSKSEFGKTQMGCCDSKGEANQARSYVARQWAAPKQNACQLFEMVTPDKVTKGDGETAKINISSLDSFLEKSKYTLAVSGMAFQDCWNLDLERLKYCHIHVVSPEGKLIPFCAYNLTSASGKRLYR